MRKSHTWFLITSKDGLTSRVPCNLRLFLKIVYQLVFKKR